MCELGAVCLTSLSTGCRYLALLCDRKHRSDGDALSRQRPLVQEMQDKARRRRNGR